MRYGKRLFMASARYENLKQRVEKIAFVSPREDGDSIRNYLFLCGEAHNILKRLGHIRRMELPEKIELDSIEIQVTTLEEKIENI